MTAPTLYAFVDETGDRGVSKSSSRFFSMATVLVADNALTSLNDAVRTVRAKLTVPDAKPFHWVDHAKTFERRQAVTSVFAPLDVTVNYLVMEKAALHSTSVMRFDQAKFYNYAAGLTLERMLLAARDWPDGERRVYVKFGHVRGHDHRTTIEYFGIKQMKDTSFTTPWNLIASPPKFLDAGASLGLQAADAYAGMLSAAVNPDHYGGYQQHHLMEVRHQIRRSPAGVSDGWGLKTMTVKGSLESLPWWPSEGL